MHSSPPAASVPIWGGSSNLFNPARHHERDLGVKPAFLNGTNFTAEQANQFIQNLEQLKSTGL